MTLELIHKHLYVSQPLGVPVVKKLYNLRLLSDTDMGKSLEYFK